MRVVCVQISSVEQARIIQLSIDTGSNRSVYHTARLVECLNCSIVVSVYLSVEILHTRNTNIYYQRTLSSIWLFVIFEITTNNKCTVYSFKEKYQLVCSSILSYILIYHIFSQIYQLFQSHSNILFQKSH